MLLVMRFVITCTCIIHNDSPIYFVHVHNKMVSDIMTRSRLFGDGLRARGRPQPESPTRALTRIVTVADRFTIPV